MRTRELYEGHKEGQRSRLANTRENVESKLS